jgi:hypothetical protein
MTHGQRKTYQAHGCRCTPCRAAEATYRASIRRLHASRRPPLRSLISPVQARQIIDRLKIEHVKQAHLARALGLKNRSLRLHPEAITVAKYLRIKLFARRLLADDSDQATCP